jgi:hypothetical protein
MQSMSDEADTVSLQSLTRNAVSAAAERMRAHRKRQREGLRCFTLEIRAREIDVLVQRGLLKPDARNDPYAIKMALYRHLDGSLRS